MYRIISSSLTHIGNVREINEDAVLETGNLFAVADGMGGHQAGEVASSLALSVIRQYIEDNLGAIPGEKLVENAIGAANSSVYAKASSSSRFRDMGTTITLLYREGNTAYIGHVGDSRAYLFRGGKLQQLTRDHSLVAKLVEDGEITEEDARQHPQRNIILRGLGLEPRVEVDFVSVKIQAGDEFLLASDGLTSMVEDPRIEKVLSGVSEPAAGARALVDLALGAGGADNVSVVIVSLEESETMVPDGGREAREAREALPAGAGAGLAAEAGAERPRKAYWKWLVVLTIILIILVGGLGVGLYVYNRTFFVGTREGKVILCKGFPFWGLSMVELETDIEVKFLPESLKSRVEGKMEVESRHDADATIQMLADEVDKNSCLVPDVEGKLFAEARVLLEKVGLQAVADLVSRPGLAPDLVLTQDPQPGTRVGKGTRVNLKVVMGGSPPEEV